MAGQLAVREEDIVSSQAIEGEMTGVVDTELTAPVVIGFGVVGRALRRSDGPPRRRA